MPKFFENWLRSLSPEQKDAMWEWADEDQFVASTIIETVGNADGLPHVRKAAG